MPRCRSPEQISLEFTLERSSPFRVLRRNGGPRTGDDQGWKDTLWVAPRETVQLLLHFGRQAGTYRYGSQNLETLDMGMAGRFEVLPGEGAAR
jgi:FtsP/CotA-like multicopper oxidase with cupredoxin domain